MSLDVRLVFHEAVVLFDEGHDDDAAVLFGQCVRTQHPLAAEASRYLTLLAERADELPFAQGVHLLETGNYRGARRKLEEVVRMGGRRRDQALSLLEDSSQSRPRSAAARPEFDLFRGPSDAPSSSDAVAGADAIRRTPHIDVSPAEPVTSGTLLAVEVYADRSAAREGEFVDELIIRDAGDAFTLDVTLMVTEHFSVEGPSRGTITITRGVERSESALFSVRVRPPGLADTSRLPDAGITALFRYHDRPAGKVTRVFAPAGRAQPAARRADHLSFEVGVTPTGAELTVTIVAKPINDDRQYWCTVQTPLLPAYASGVTGDWNLKDRSEKIVADFMQGFTEQHERSLLVAKLKGAGRELFKLAPAVFRDAFWALVDTGQRLEQISIVSEEPFIPWELMVPTRHLGGVLDKRDPLGVEFRVGRWTRPGAIAARRAIALEDSYVIAPQYVGDRALPFAQEEARLLIERFNATPITPATFENIQAQFKAGGRNLIHIACHGADDTADQAIYLENDKKLPSVAFAGMDAADTAFGQKNPLVFLNACEVGRVKPALIGVGGFAAAFIDKGASAVIAPLWSVKDEIAHVVAQGFYEQIDTKPLAEILREFRKRAYDPAVAEDSYAAYCFYGDPDAVRVPHPVAK